MSQAWNDHLALGSVHGKGLEHRAQRGGMSGSSGLRWGWGGRGDYISAEPGVYGVENGIGAGGAALAQVCGRGGSFLCPR